MRIDENLEETMGNVDNAQLQLQKYFDSISSNRWLILKAREEGRGNSGEGRGARKQGRGKGAREQGRRRTTEMGELFGKEKLGRTNACPRWLCPLPKGRSLYPPRDALSICAAATR